MKKDCLILILILASVVSFAQIKIEKPPTKKHGFHGIRFGVTASDYYRLPNEKFQQPLKKPNYKFHAGLIFDIINLKKFASQIELSYVNKGSKEVFLEQNEEITVTSKLSYGQIDLIPIQIKPLGNRKFSPYISCGVYGAYLLSSKINYKVGNDFDRKLEFQNFNKKDYGFLINGGVKIETISLEYRHEFGTKSIVPSTELKNQLNNITLKLTTR